MEGMLPLRRAYGSTRERAPGEREREHTGTGRTLTWSLSEKGGKAAPQQRRRAPNIINWADELGAAVRRLSHDGVPPEPLFQRCCTEFFGLQHPG